MRIGILGSGMMGQQHLAALATLPGLSAVTRTSPAYAGRSFPNREAFYCALIHDPEIDAIDICLPTALHPDIALAALQAGKHVLCEKPLALDLPACRRIVAAASRSRATFMVAHVVRFFPAYIHLAHAVRDHRYGPLLTLNLTRVSGLPSWAPWLTDPSESGGAILDLLIHDFDQALALCGPPATVTASPIDSPNTLHCTLTYPSATVHIEGGWFTDGRHFAMAFRARFSQGELLFADNQLTLTTPAYPQPIHIALPDIDPYAEQLRAFVTCCQAGAQPDACTVADGLAAVQLSLAARSLAQHSPGIPSPCPNPEDHEFALEQ